MYWFFPKNHKIEKMEKNEKKWKKDLTNFLVYV